MPAMLSKTRVVFGRFDGICPELASEGGVRVIYYWRVAADQILMLLAYKKAKQADLTPSQKRALKTVVENWNG